MNDNEIIKGLERLSAEDPDGFTAELRNALETKCDNCDNIRLSRPEYWRAISQAKSEAYKEFAEALKREALSDRGYEILQSGTIDDLLKRMVVENVNV